MSGIRPFRSPHGGEEVRFNFPLGPTQSFDAGDPVFISSNQIITAPADGTAVLDTELYGFAFDRAIGVSQVGAPAGALPTAGTENEFRSILVPVAGQTYVTPNLWTSPLAAGARNRPVGTDLLLELQIVFNNLGTANFWGLLDTAATIDTHAVAQVIAIYTDRGGTTLGGTLGPGDPIDADDTTNGVWVEFRIIGNNQFDQSVAT